MASNNQGLVTLLQLLAGKVPQAVNPGIQFDPSAPFAQPPVLGIGQPPQPQPQQPKPASAPGQPPPPPGQPAPPATRPFTDPGWPPLPPVQIPEPPPAPGYTPGPFGGVPNVNSTITFGGEVPPTEDPSVGVSYPGFGPDPNNDPGNSGAYGYVPAPGFTGDGSGYGPQDFAPFAGAGDSGPATFDPTVSDNSPDTSSASYDYFGG